MNINGADLVNKKMLFELLTKHKNKIKGEVPENLLTEVQDVQTPVKEEKRYQITKETVYFDPETYRLQEGTVNLSETVKGFKIVVNELPEMSFVYFKKPSKKHPGIFVVNNGFLGSTSTPEWVKNIELDPLNCFIDKVKGTDKTEIDELMNKVHKSMTERETEILERRAEGDKVPTPEEEDIFYSWGIEDEETDLKTDISDLVNPSLTFNVCGFLFEGQVKVTYNSEVKKATIELLNDEEGEDPVLLSIDQIKLTELQDAVDRLVEYDGEFEDYQELVWETYPEDRKMKVAA
jgi:hypothetical protein